MTLWPADSLRPTAADLASARDAYQPVAAAYTRDGDAIAQSAYLREVIYYLEHGLSHAHMLAGALAEGKILIGAEVVRMMRARIEIHHEATCARVPETLARLRELAGTDAADEYAAVPA